MSSTAVSSTPYVPISKATMLTQPSQFAQNMAKSLTIDEMRFLHQRALNDADDKRTELKLVLASRYRELVGSSDEVIKMQERAQELHNLVRELPMMLEKLSGGVVDMTLATKESNEIPTNEQNQSYIVLRRKLTGLPLDIHRAIDKGDVHEASVYLIELFTLISSRTNQYPLSNELSKVSVVESNERISPELNIQMKMSFQQVQTMSDKICRTAYRFLSISTMSCNSGEARFGAQKSAAALASLALLGNQSTDLDKAERLLSAYFEAKSVLLSSLRQELMLFQSDDMKTTVSASNAESIISRIVLVLQYDIILYPYQIFVLRNFQESTSGDATKIMRSLPKFDESMVRQYCTKFLSTHLQLIRNKVKIVLVSIAGTTASALGQIRQSLYDRTDGIEALKMLDQNCICTWDDAVRSMVDSHVALSNTGEGVHNVSSQKFSLWAALFSVTFTSLVNSILTTAFLSVHTNLVSSLQVALSNAPPLVSILPHEAYMNTLRLTSDLDKALLKVSEDAHELLIHAEERVESERRLRESLFVETCKIMGRLICELRRMTYTDTHNRNDATKQLIIGRLCFLMKFRLTALPDLLSSDSQRQSIRSAVGLIDFFHLKSSFELADHDDDGFITYDEAIEVVESAFAGTSFSGSDMVRETLLLSLDGNGVSPSYHRSVGIPPSNVTLGELSLLTASGLRFEKSGSDSAMVVLQESFDLIISGCFQKWASAALQPASLSLQENFHSFVNAASRIQEKEWARSFGGINEGNSATPGVSSYIAGYFMQCATILNLHTCPSDSLPPLPSNKFAERLGILVENNDKVESLSDWMRCSTVVYMVTFVMELLANDKATSMEGVARFENVCPSSLKQLVTDVDFMEYSFVKALEQRGFFGKYKVEMEHVLQKLHKFAVELSSGGATNDDEKKETNQAVLNASEIFFSALFGFVTKDTSVIRSAPLVNIPVSSSRRFALLSVQDDRSLNEIQLKGAYTKVKDNVVDTNDTTSGNVMSSGFGFFSSMLKKK